MPVRQLPHLTKRYHDVVMQFEHVIPPRCFACYRLKIFLISLRSWPAARMAPPCCESWFVSLSRHSFRISISCAERLASTARREPLLQVRCFVQRPRMRLHLRVRPARRGGDLVIGLAGEQDLED